MKTKLLITALIILSLALGTLVILLVRGFIVDNQSCTVGIAGTTVSLTFQGENSHTVCQGLVKDSVSYNVYIMTSVPQGDVVCEGDTNSFAGLTVHYIVRDRDPSHLMSGKLCRNFQTVQTETSTPTNQTNNQSCTLDFAGSDANITYQGDTSLDLCQNEVNIGYPSDVLSYDATTTPQGSVLCEGDFAYEGSAIHYLIRDAVMYGRGYQLCSDFKIMVP